MANEGRFSYTLKVAKGSINDRPSANFNFDMTGTKKESVTFDVGTSWEQLSFSSDFGTTGFARIINNDDTNFVEVGNWNSGTAKTFLKLEAGESFVVRLSLGKAEIAAQADTASVELIVELYED